MCKDFFLDVAVKKEGDGGERSGGSSSLGRDRYVGQDAVEAGRGVGWTNDSASRAGRSGTLIMQRADQQRPPQAATEPATRERPEVAFTAWVRPGSFFGLPLLLTRASRRHSEATGNRQAAHALSWPRLPCSGTA